MRFQYSRWLDIEWLKKFYSSYPIYEILNTQILINVVYKHLCLDSSLSGDSRDVNVTSFIILNRL